MTSWYRRWLLRRIIAALSHATELGVSDEVISVAKSFEATSRMVRSQKRDSQVSITLTKRELDVFISYLTRLHHSKLALLTRAKYGLATLFMSDKMVLDGQDPIEFYKQHVSQARSGKTIQRLR